MITIIQCLNSLDVGGLEQVVLMLAQQVPVQHFRSCICCIEERGALADQAERAGIEVVALQAQKTSRLHALKVLRKFLAERHPTIIHSHNFKPFHYAALMRMMGATAAHVHTWHGICALPWRYRLFRPWVDELVTVSNQGRSRLARACGLPTERISGLVNGVDTQRFRPACSSITVRRVLGLPENCLAILSVGRLVPQKDFGTLLRAFALILKAVPHAELWLAGPGPERTELENLSRKLDVNSKTRFLGARQDVDKLLQAADVFTLSSIDEGLPVALCEAAACGLPIVATDVGGNAEVVNAPRCGRLVPPRNPEALATELLALLRDEPTRQAMGIAARQNAIERFSLDTMVNRYVALYEQALGHR